MQEWYGDLSNMTKRYGMEKAHQRRQKAKAKAAADKAIPMSDDSSDDNFNEFNA